MPSTRARTAVTGTGRDDRFACTATRTPSRTSTRSAPASKRGVRPTAYPSRANSAASVSSNPRQAALEVELEAGDGRDEAAEGEQRRRPRAAAAEAERVRHHGALREPAERRPLGRHAGLLH